MNEQRIETNESPHILISECGGQVVVKSWRETAVSIQGTSFTVEQNGSIHIIKSYQRDIFRNPKPIFMSISHETQRHGVVHAEDSIGSVF